MQKNTLALWTLTALMQSAMSNADYVPSPMPQGSPPPISEQTKQLIRGQIQASPKLPTNSTTTAPQKQSVNLSGAGNAPTDNLDNQHAYHNKIKQHLKTHKL